MQEKIIVNINNISDIEKYKSKEINNFLIPLDGFCVGYNTWKLEDLKNLNTEYYLLLNRLLTFKDLDNLKNILKYIDTTYLKGIFFEDLAVLEIIKELNLNVEKIYFPNHFGTNYASINAFLKRGIDSMVISNEITKEEVEEILSKVSKSVVVPILGYNQIMYSRRNLISNYNKEYDLTLNKNNQITEQVTKRKFNIKENEYGTVIFDEDIYNNIELLKLKNNVKFYLINSTDLSLEEIILFLERNNSLKNNSFLNKKTIYKVGKKNEE